MGLTDSRATCNRYSTPTSYTIPQEGGGGNGAGGAVRYSRSRTGKATSIVCKRGKFEARNW